MEKLDSYNNNDNRSHYACQAPVPKDSANSSTNFCPHCKKLTKLFFVRDKFSKSLLRACCGSYARSCPKPSDLLKSPALSFDDRAFLKHLAKMKWLDKPDLERLLQLEEISLTIVATSLPVGGVA